MRAAYQYRMKSALALFAMGLALADSTAADGVHLLSLDHNGVLRWTNSATRGYYRVEWASAVTGPWFSSWDGLTNLPAAGTNLVVAVPMFYRVVFTPPAPVLSNVTASVALCLLTNRIADPGFVVLDVRTPAEFGARHVKGARNLNFYAADFGQRLAELNRDHAYLVYCASGGRSGNTLTQMRALGFVEVYNLSAGFSSLANLPESAAWLEP